MIVSEADASTRSHLDAFHPAQRTELLPPHFVVNCASFFHSLRYYLPVTRRPEALENVGLIGVRADQDPRLAAFRAAQNPRRSCLRRGPKKPLKPGSLLLTSRSCNTGPDARAARNLRSDPSRVHAR